jgi:hypothetical protein
MKKAYQLAVLLLALNSLAIAAHSQSMVPLIARCESKVKSLERSNKIVEKTLFDIIYKNNSSTFTYLYTFYQADTYDINVVYDDATAGSLNLKIFKYVTDKWVLVKQTFAVEYGLSFHPDATAIYDIEVSCQFKNNAEWSNVGLIIDRQ